MHLLADRLHSSLLGKEPKKTTMINTNVREIMISTNLSLNTPLSPTSNKRSFESYTWLCWQLNDEHTQLRNSFVFPITMWLFCIWICFEYWWLSMTLKSTSWDIHDIRCKLVRWSRCRFLCQRRYCFFCLHQFKYSCFTHLT